MRSEEQRPSCRSRHALLKEKNECRRYNMVKASELKDKPADELKALYRDLSKQIYELSNEMKVTRKTEKPHLKRSHKRDRARVLTVLRQMGESITN